MNILMVTNTYTPHVGGVAKSVEAFTNEYRKLGHRVIVVAPEFENLPEDEVDVIRVPAIQNFNGSDFSLRIPIPGFVASELEENPPDIVHCHHPFLLGDTGLRIATMNNVPLVFTHHTLYEQYTHYVPGDSSAMQRFVIEMTTGFANLCDLVFAPSESVASLIQKRGVETPIEVIPTGVYTDLYAKGDREGFRSALGLAADMFVVGHVGRLAPEKNLRFLAEAVGDFLVKEKNAHFVVVGKGPSETEIRECLDALGVGERLHFAGVLRGQALVDAYHGMDVFAFASQSETQGMVLTEAMAASVPVVAVNASGAREVVKNRVNGHLLQNEDRGAFAAALAAVAGLSREEGERMKAKARETGERFS
ncbi:MAG: glycosyltransferase, partial [bacterium]